MTTGSSSSSLSLSLDSTVQLPFLLRRTLRRRFRTAAFRLPKLSSFITLSHSSSSASSSLVPDLPKPGAFLDSEGQKRLDVIEDFVCTHEFDHGSLEIRAMAGEELDATVDLLAESFAESIWGVIGYVPLLAFLIKNYLLERRNLFPHAVVLVGQYRGRDEGDEASSVVACVAEVSFDEKGSNAELPSPAPPKDQPYVCNMTVKKPLRRKGLGWHLLKACEDLVRRIKLPSAIYLHCRVIDEGPFAMYTKAGYTIKKTDSLFMLLLKLQRRKHLMFKSLHEEHEGSQSGPTAAAADH